MGKLDELRKKINPLERIHRLEFYIVKYLDLDKNDPIVERFNASFRTLEQAERYLNVRIKEISCFYNYRAFIYKVTTKRVSMVDLERMDALLFAYRSYVNIDKRYCFKQEYISSIVCFKSEPEKVEEKMEVYAKRAGLRKITRGWVFAKLDNFD